MEREQTISKYVSEACKIALDPKHGYSQKNRNGDPDFDCSSLVIEVLERANLPVRKHGASYTGNLYSALIKCGFEVVSDEGEQGDIYLTPNDHVLIYVGDKTVVHAVADENGRAEGKQSGDQTGKEIRLEVVTNLNTYKYHLRLKEDKTLTKATVANCYYVNVRASASGSSKILTVLAKGMEVDILREKGEWFNIAINGVNGYVKRDYLEVK